MTTPGGQLTPGNEPEMDDPPIYGVPDGAYVGEAASPQSIKDLNTLTPDKAKERMRIPLNGTFNNLDASVRGNGGLLGQIATMLFGSGPGGPASRIADGMTALNGRLNLLDNVPGYAGAAMARNYRFGAGTAYKKIPFDSDYGPKKKAQLDIATNRMVMETGSWSAHFTISTSGGGNVGHGIRALVRDRDGTEVMTRYFDWQAGAGWDQHFAMPLIVPPETAPWSLELGYRHNGVWWTLFGGTEKTLLWVERKNIDTANSEIIRDPPNGPDIN